MSDPQSKLDSFLSGIDKNTLIPQESALDTFYKMKDVRSNTKRIVTHELSDGSAPAYIIPIGDVHLGNKGCNVRKLQYVINLILKTPNCYTIILGDLAETATKESVGKAMFDEDIHLPDQIAAIVSALKPLALKGKILGVITGNHEMRMEYLTGINPMFMIADKLDIPYLGFQGYIRANVGQQSYNIMCHHGVGGGSTAAGKMKSAERLNKVADADIYISGHTHGLNYFFDEIMTFGQSDEIIPKKRHYVSAGSFLDYWDGYAEMKLLQPSTCGSVFIELRNDVKDVRVTI